MIKHLFLILGLLAALTLAEPVLACTSAVVSGKVTLDGRPLLWKNRDTDYLRNHVAYVKGEKYDFSVFSKVLDDTKGGKVLVRLTTKDGKEIAQAAIRVSSTEWKKQKAVLTATADAADAVLSVCPQMAGKYALDMVSLFPQNTFKGRKNGLRADLAQTLADLHPRFVRFPGGCVAHGDGVDNIYDWKGSIGALEERKPLRNLVGLSSDTWFGIS